MFFTFITFFYNFFLKFISDDFKKDLDVSSHYDLDANYHCCPTLLRKLETHVWMKMTYVRQCARSFSKYVIYGTQHVLFSYRV